MLTPQEVASHAFAKATFGGYSMAMVDEFLDSLTEDYTALYNDNAILKNKLKVLSDSVEEYRATDVAMRKTLLAAQQMAEKIVAEAEQRKNTLVQDAETAASERINELRRQVAQEEYRLKAAQEATAAYVAKLTKIHEAETAFLAHLSELVPEGTEVKNDPAEDIRAALSNLTVSEPVNERDGAVDEPTQIHQIQPPVPDEDVDADATRRFESIDLSKDYTIV